MTYERYGNKQKVQINHLPTDISHQLLDKTKGFNPATPKDKSFSGNTQTTRPKKDHRQALGSEKKNNNRTWMT